MSSIILLHGAIGAADQLEPLKHLLQEAKLEVYSFSFSGHGGKSFSNRAFEIETFALELEQFIIANKLQSPSVFGYSMGGFVALQLAATAPGILNKIITLGTKFKWDKETATKESGLLNPETIEQKVPKFADTLKQRHGVNQWKELLAKTAQMMQELANKNLLTEEVLAKINNKVLIGLADKDNMVTYEETREVYSKLPNANMFMLPGSKHPIEQVNIELLTQQILFHFKS